MLNNFASQAHTRRPNSAVNYPTLGRAATGRGVDIHEDAIGRAVVKNPMRPTSGDDNFPSAGGFARPKGMESYTEDILAASQAAMGQQVSRAQDIKSQMLSRAAQPTQAPGGIGGLSEQDYRQFLPETGGRRPPSARLQALAMMRKQGAAPAATGIGRGF